VEQTFLSYVTTDTRFWVASTMASARSMLVPATLASAGVSLAVAPEAAFLVFAALVFFVACDWVLLVVRMARRIALRLEDPNALLERSVLGNAAYLHHAYYVKRVELLRTV
jgi:hypothetical protein